MSTLHDQRVAIYAKIWAGAEPQPDGSRIRKTARIGKVVRGAARAAGISLSNHEADKMVDKLRWIKIDAHSRPQRMICTIDPANLQSENEKTAIPPSDESVPVATTTVATSVAAATAYRFLYRERSKLDEARHRYTSEPLRELLNKWPNHDAQQTLDSILLHEGWTRVDSQRLYLLLDPSTLKNGDERVHSTTDAPPAPGAALLTDIVILQPDAAPVPITSCRRPHGLKGVCMTAVEKKVWDLFKQGQADEQPRGGWNLGEAPDFSLTDIVKAAEMKEPANVLSVVGRFCAAELLVCISHHEYRLAWNPLDMVIKIITRRMIVPSHDREQHLSQAKEIATTLARPNGTIPNNEFCLAVSRRWNMTVSTASKVLLDYDLGPGSSGAGGALHVLVSTDQYGAELLLAPTSLSGCDFFPSRSVNSKKSCLVQPSDDLYATCRYELRKKYEAAAAFTDIKPEAIPLAEAPPATLPAPPEEAPTTIEAPTIDVCVDPIDLFEVTPAPSEEPSTSTAEEALRRAHSALTLQEVVLRQTTETAKAEILELLRKTEEATARLKTIEAKITAAEEERVSLGAIITNLDEIAAEEAKLAARKAELLARITNR